MLCSVFPLQTYSKIHAYTFSPYNMHRPLIKFTSAHSTGLVVSCSYYVCHMFLAVVGDKEQSNQTVNVRTRDNQVHGEYPVDDLVSRLHSLSTSRVLDDSKEFAKE